MSVEYTLKLFGAGVDGGKPRPGPLGQLIWRIDEAVRGSVGMGFRHSSRFPGRKPAWLARAADIRLTGLSAGNDGATLLHYEAPQFGDAAAEVYRQTQMFDAPPDPSDTAFNLLGDILNDVSAAVKDSERYDVGLLRRFEKVGGSLGKRGIDSVKILGDRLSSSAPPTIDGSLAASAARLYQETPAPKRVRVAGKLDMIRASDSVFTLILEKGERVRGVWAGGETESLAGRFSQQVVVGGLAVFRASGALLRIDAETMDLATEADRFFSRLPQPKRSRTNFKEMIRDQRQKRGVAAIFGKWPGDETDEQIQRALEELS